MHVNMLIELRIPFLVSLSYEALISDRKILEDAQSPKALLYFTVLLEIDFLVSSW